jgi:predicted DNA-binding protein YlxM (UPF0122 family)
MTINTVRKYELTKKKKEVIEAYLNGEITQLEAANEFGVTRQGFAVMAANVCRHLVTSSSAFSKALGQELKSY